MYFFRLFRLGTLGLVAALASIAQSASAQVIFEENFAARGYFEPITGTPPSPTNAGSSFYLRGERLAGATELKIDDYGDLQEFKGLLFKPSDTAGTPVQDELAGTWGQNIYIPYNYTFGSDRVKMTITLRKETVDWNNFAFGFTDHPGGNLQNFILLQHNPSGGNPPANPYRIRSTLTHAGAEYSRNHPPGAYAEAFQTFALEYDPELVDTPGVNPYTFTINGNVMGGPLDSIPDAGGADDGVPGMTSMTGIGFGFWQALGTLDRSAVIQSWKFEILPAVVSQPGDFNADGIVDAADYVYWRKDPSVGTYEVWSENFGEGTLDLGGGGSTTVPEPASGSILLIGLIVGGTICNTRRRRQAA